MGGKQSVLWDLRKYSEFGGDVFVHVAVADLKGQYAAITTALVIGSENNRPKQTTNQRWTLTLKTIELRPKGIQ